MYELILYGLKCGVGKFKLEYLYLLDKGRMCMFIYDIKSSATQDLNCATKMLDYLRLRESFWCGKFQIQDLPLHRSFYSFFSLQC